MTKTDQVQPAQALHIRRARDTDAKQVLTLLESDHHLEVAFDPAEFVVAILGSRVVACARLKPITQREAEIASVVVDPAYRGLGFGAKVVDAVLADAPPVVYALALAPGFFAGRGFRQIPSVPTPLVGKATSVCARSGFVPMVRGGA